MDLYSNKLDESLGHPRFHFLEGDIAINKEWIEYHIKKCDVVLPLVAIATPMTYVKKPLRVFELDFEENLRVVRQCVKYGTRIIFPSTSEVYGMCPDARVLRGRQPPWCWDPSTNSAGSIAAPSSSWTGSSGLTARTGSSGSPCSAPSTGSAPSWTTSTPPRKGVPGW